MIEIELKFRISDANQLQQKLLGAGFTKIDTKIQKDTYFNSPMRDFAKTDEALRIRIIDDFAELTYKGRKFSSNSKSRVELNTQVSSPNELKEILLALDFREVLTVEKIRTSYKNGKITATIDEIKGLGFFMEIETISSEETFEENEQLLLELCQSMGFDPKEQIRTSYLEMLLTKMGLE